VVKSNQKVVRQ